MTKEHLSIITEYSKGAVTKESLIESYGINYVELLELYLNDLNSSRLRQDITCYVLGLDSNENKLGYDSTTSNDEVKPKNISSKKDKIKKLDGGGNYSDLTHRRHEKYLSDNANINVSGFVDGRLMYILKVPYSDLQTHFKRQLDYKLPSGDVSGVYVRSAQFSFTQIKECPNASVVFVRDDIENYYSYIKEDLYYYIKDKRNEQ